MRIVAKTIEYAGIVEPRSPGELEIEIYGLKNAIRQAEELISRHEQAIALARLMQQRHEEAPYAVEKRYGGVAAESDIPSQEEAEE